MRDTDAHGCDGCLLAPIDWNAGCLRLAIFAATDSGMATTLNSSSRSAERSALPVEIQIGCFAVSFLYAIFFQETRALGAPGLAIAFACIIVIWLPMMRWYVQRPLWWLTALAALYTLISMIGWLHWNTLLFDRSVIIQQASYAFLLPVMVPIFAYYHERVDRGDTAFLAFEKFLILICLIGKAYYAYMIGSISGLGVIQLFNIESIFAFLIVRQIYGGGYCSKGMRALVVLLFVATAGSFQSQLVAMFLLGGLIVPRLARAGLLVFIFGLVAISIAAVPFADAIWQLDPNTGIRLFFWHDAIERIIASYGVGQGFGTETIRPLYQLSSTDVSIAGIEQADFILVGSHNAFVDAGYRMGLLGGGILIWYIAGLFKKTAAIASEGRTFDYFVCAMLFVVLMVNVGLASINFLFGAAFLIGWLAYRAAAGFPGAEDAIVHSGSVAAPFMGSASVS
ncbi:hypothetical protein KY084_05160 [Stakelama sp. CBK3Z-3]|uniref:O-antigen ligase family protein n=1 Tax=Stakelama flava TaxID=2860338 RepID=A0ABS6XK08_9SPHN|nr:hypothetical protein [Stakelama flava]MBW4330259.1 hypothetical protein [Stakelama flava]